MADAGRPAWPDYFLGIATAVAARADCTRRRIGAVIVSADNRIVATGYNGSRPGGPSCLKGECPRGLLSKDEVPSESSYDTGAGVCVAVHAEQNALLWSSREDRKGSTIYITDQPCPGCVRFMSASGLARAVWPGGSQEF